MQFVFLSHTLCQNVSFGAFNYTVATHRKYHVKKSTKYVNVMIFKQCNLQTNTHSVQTRNYLLQCCDFTKLETNIFDKYQHAK